MCIRDSFWTVLGSTVAEVPKGEHLVVMMDANARTGITGEGCVDDKVLGAYGWDTLNDNGWRLPAFSAENQLVFVNTFFSALKRGISYTFQSPKCWKRSLPPGLYPHAANRQTNRTIWHCAPTSCSETGVRLQLGCSRHLATWMLCP